MDLHEIQPIPIIPDYVEPTSSLNPIVIKGPAGCHCIEGWPLIQEALKAEARVIRCLVYTLTDISDEELAIRKVAIRVVPQGGNASYAEIVRNVRILFQLLCATAENPIIYSHGGARRGAVFSNNRGDNVRAVLAERLKKSITTINKYLNHGENLTDEAISALVQARADKEFFEKAQIVKRKILTNLISSKAPEEEIFTQVSEAMLRMHRDPNEIENLRNGLFYAPEEEQSSGETPENDSLEKVSDKVASFKHWGGAEESSPEASLNERDIRKEITAIAKKMISQSEDPNMPLPALKESITADIGDLLSLLQKIGEAENPPRQEGA